MRDFVFIDIETTGLDPIRHGIIEIATVRCRAEPGLPEVGRWSVMVLPHIRCEVDPEATALTGYDRAEWVKCGAEPITRELLLELGEVMAGAVPAGHCLHFDLAFIERLFRGHEIEPTWHHRRLDTCVLAWPLLLAGEVESTSLAALAEWARVRNHRPHKALSDIRATVEVARRLLARRRMVA